MNESKVVCFFDLLCLFVCFVWFVVCLFVWFKVGSLLILFINQSINEMKWTKPTNFHFYCTHYSQSTNVSQVSISSSILSFHLSSQSNPINQSKENNWQTRQKKRNRWMNEWIEINLTDKSIHVQLITESQFDLVWLSISFSNQLTNQLVRN